MILFIVRMYDQNRYSSSMSNPWIEKQIEATDFQDLIKKIQEINIQDVSASRSDYAQLHAEFTHGFNHWYFDYNPAGNRKRKILHDAEISVNITSTRAELRQVESYLSASSNVHRKYSTTKQTLSEYDSLNEKNSASHSQLSDKERAKLASLELNLDRFSLYDKESDKDFSGYEGAKSFVQKYEEQEKLQEELSQLSDEQKDERDLKNAKDVLVKQLTEKAEDVKESFTVDCETDHVTSNPKKPHLYNRDTVPLLKYKPKPLSESSSSQPHRQSVVTNGPQPGEQ